MSNALPMPDDQKHEYDWTPEMERAAQAIGFPGTGPKDRAAKKVAALIDQFDKAQENWDTVYPEVVADAEARGMKTTEEKLRVAVRNEMRLRDMEIPATVLWKLRAALGGVEAHE